MNIVELFNKVKNTAGSNDKKTILKENMSDLLKMIFEDTYGVQKYHITKKILPKEFKPGILTIENGYIDFHKDLERLSNKEVSGNAAVAMISGMIDCFIPEAQSILLAVIDRNLKIGVSFDNFNSILDTKIEKYQVPLAFNIKDVKNVNPIDGTYFASRKLDGVRCEAHINNYKDETGNLIQEVTFKSRVGKEYKTLDNLKEAVKSFTKSLVGEWVLDGECCITDEDGNEDFSGIMQEITRKNHTIEHPRYKLFDIVRQSVFDKKEESYIYQIRLGMLNNLQNTTDEQTKQYIQVLDQELLTSQEQFDKWAGWVKENGWEGFMLHRNEPYRQGRTKDLLKVKKFKDAEFIVTDLITGKVTYNENGAKEYDAVSSIAIEFKGNRVDVGSGLSKEQRLRWFEHPEEIIGKTITVQYFEETKDVKTGLPSLRFPVLKYVYENGRNI